MRSVESVACDKIVERAREVRRIAAGDMSQLIESKKKQNDKRYKIPAYVSTFIKPKHFILAKTDCYVFGEGKKCVMYLHGGSYVDPPMIFHWRFLQRLQKDAGVTVIVPVYNRAPDHKCDETVPAMASIFLSLAKKYGAENVYLMGDSAGGGMSMAVAETLAAKKQPLPAKVMVFSPWMDINLDNPAIDRLKESDVMLIVHELVIYGVSYLGRNPFDFYMASPLFGITDSLPETHVFVGSSEVFLPDCLLLKKKADECGADVRVYEFPFMQHVFPLMPIPEATEVRKTIINLINER